MAQPHEVLGVAANADEAAISAAFRRAAKRFHPDLNNGDTSGIRRLQRLIAARDFLTGPRWRAASASQARFLLPSFRKNRITKSVVLTFVATGTCAFLLLPTFAPGQAKDNPPSMGTPRIGTGGISVVKKSSMANAEAPDAGSAEIKAIRDLQEAPADPRLDEDALTDRLLQVSAKRPASSPADKIRKAVKGAAKLVSKAFQKIAAEL